jgi:hypothetical protein
MFITVELDQGAQHKASPQWSVFEFDDAASIEPAVERVGASAALPINAAGTRLRQW